MANQEYEPRVIIETASYRVIAKSQPPFEGKQRGDEIMIEQRARTGMGESYWGPIHHLWDSRHCQTKDERLLLSIFQEVAKQAPVAPGKSASLSDLIKGPMEFTAGQPIRHSAGKSETRAKFAELLRELAKTVKGQVTIPPDMPFDNRDNCVGLDISPGLMAQLHATFPGLPYALIPIQLVMKLLERSAEELLAASER